MRTVVFNCDNNYVMPTCVVILSINENNPQNSEYEFYILISEPINQSSKNFIERLKLMRPELNIQYIEAYEYIQGAITNGNHITVSTYLRLFIPWILSNHDRCVFLDSDIIVNCDLDDLWKINMKDTYVAGVKEYTIAKIQSRQRIKKEELDVPELNSYIYAGVMVMNLKLMRENNLFEKFKEGILIGYQFQDQDILNKYCYGRIGHIPLRFNFLNRHMEAQRLLDREIYAEEEIMETKENKVLIHFPGKSKPWIFPWCKGANEWWTYADKLLTSDEKKKLLEDAKEYRNRIRWKTLRDKCDKYNHIIVWGFSEIGCSVIDSLLKNGYSNIIAIGDNDKEKIGKIYKGIRVFSAQEIASFSDALIVNTSQLAYNKINSQLMNSGFNEDNIFVYRNKGKIFYKSLYRTEYEMELREIFYREYGSYDKFDEYGYETALEHIDLDWIERYYMDRWLFL